MLKPYHPFLRHLSLELGNWGISRQRFPEELAWREPNDYWARCNEPQAFYELCQYISQNLPSLKSVIFWFLITESQYDRVLNDEKDIWFEAARSIVAEKVEVVLFIHQHAFRYPILDDPGRWLANDTTRGIENPDQLYYRDSARAEILVKLLSQGRILSLTRDAKTDLGITVPSFEQEQYLRRRKRMYRARR